MKIRVVVTGKAEACLYDAVGYETPLELVGRMDNETARQYDQELESDRPGRAFGRMGAGRHAMGGEHSPKRLSQKRFARSIADRIDQGRVANEFERVVVIAGPEMMGLLRAAVSDGVRSSIVAEIPKDLAQVDARTLQGYIPREAFFS